MKPFFSLITILASVACLNTALGESRMRSIEQHLRYTAVVAEVRIEWIRVQRAPTEKFDDLFCECTVLQGFKMPVATNKLILRLNFSGTARVDYEQKTAVLFAFENERGGFTPWGAQQGLVLTNQVFVETVEVAPRKYARKDYKYDELIREIKKVIEANKRSAANGGSRPVAPVMRVRPNKCN